MMASGKQLPQLRQARPAVGASLERRADGFRRRQTLFAYGGSQRVQAHPKASANDAALIALALSRPSGQQACLLYTSDAADE